MEFDKLKFLITEETNKLKSKIGDGTSNEFYIGLLQGYFDVMNMIRRIEFEEHEVKNVYERKF